MLMACVSLCGQLTEVYGFLYRAFIGLPCSKKMAGRHDETLRDKPIQRCDGFSNHAKIGTVCTIVLTYRVESLLLETFD
jgi:hypothetical protein